MAKKATDDATKKQVEDFNKMFGDDTSTAPAETPKVNTDTPAAAS